MCLAILCLVSVKGHGRGMMIVPYELLGSRRSIPYAFVSTVATLVILPTAK